MWKPFRMQHNEIKNIKRKFYKMRDGLRRPNIYLVEAVLEKIRYNGRKAKFEEIFMKDFPESKKHMHTQNEELHQVPQNRIYRKKSTLRH